MAATTVTIFRSRDVFLSFFQFFRIVLLLVVHLHLLFVDSIYQTNVNESYPFRIITLTWLLFLFGKRIFFLLSLFDSIQCFPFSSLLFRRFSIYIHCFPVVCTIKNAAKKRTHVFVRTMKDLSICVTRYLR